MSDDGYRRYSDEEENEEQEDNTEDREDEEEDEDEDEDMENFVEFVEDKDYYHCKKILDRKLSDSTSADNKYEKFISYYVKHHPIIDDLEEENAAWVLEKLLLVDPYYKEAIIFARDEEGQTILFKAVAKEYKSVVEVLLRKKGDLKLDAVEPCTFLRTGFNYERQEWRRCESCIEAGRMEAGSGICLRCCEACHSGHELSEINESGFYCDCGGNSSQGFCLLLQCTGKVKAITDTNEDLRMFKCTTDGATVCHVCSRMCHSEHSTYASVAAEGRRCDCGVEKEKGDSTTSCSVEKAMYTKFVKLVDVPDSEKRTALMKACMSGNSDIVSALLKYDPQMGVKNDSDETALMLACRRGDYEVCRIILDYMMAKDLKKLLEDEDTDGDTPLFYAVYGGHRKIVQLLISKGANVTHMTHAKQTPLFYAARNGEDVICKMVIEALKSKEEKENLVCQIDSDHETALHVAARNRQDHVVKLLLENGATKCINERDADGDTALISACAAGSKEVVQVLLKHKADMEACNDRGEMALMCAAEKGCKGAVKLLLLYECEKSGSENLSDDKVGEVYRQWVEKKKKANPSFEPMIDRRGEMSQDYYDEDCEEPKSAVDLATSEKHMDIVGLLIACGAEAKAAADMKYDNGVTALMMASKQGLDQFVNDILTKEKKTVLDKDAKDRSALMYAAHNKQADICKKLLDTDISCLNWQDADKNTALIYSTVSGDDATFDEILKFEPKIDAANYIGWSALFVASYHARAEMTRDLLCTGADPFLKDSLGLNALTWAIWGKSNPQRLDVVRTLTESMSRQLEKKAHNSSKAKQKYKLDFAVSEFAREYKSEEERWELPHIVVHALGIKTPFTQLSRMCDRSIHAALLFSEAFEREATLDKSNSRELIAKADACIDLATAMLDEMDEKEKGKIIESIIVGAKEKNVQEKTSTTFFQKMMIGLGVSKEDPEAKKSSRTALQMAADLRPVAGKFLGHPAAQKCLDDIWITPKDGKKIDEKNIYDQILLEPFKMPFSIFTSQTGFFATPRGKFSVEIIFFLLFLGLYSWTIFTPRIQPAPQEWALLVLVVAFIFSELQQMWGEGLEYFESIWNAIDLASEVIFIVFFSLRFVGLGIDNYELITLGFNLLAVNSVLLWLRLLHVCDLHPKLGPLLTIIKNMFTDAAIFIVIMIVVLIGFAESIAALYQDPLTPNPSVKFGDALSMLLYALLGQVDFNNLQDDFPILGPLLLTLYLLFSAVLLLNLLIAIFSNTYSQTQTISDAEFNFGKANTYLEYQQELEFMPPPFNLVAMLLSPVNIFKTDLNKRLCSFLFLLALTPFATVYLFIRPFTHKTKAKPVRLQRKGSISVEVDDAKEKALAILNEESRDDESVSDDQPQDEEEETDPFEFLPRTVFTGIDAAAWQGKEFVIRMEQEVAKMREQMTTTAAPRAAKAERSSTDPPSRTSVDRPSILPIVPSGPLTSMASQPGASSQQIIQLQTTTTALASSIKENQQQLAQLTSSSTANKEQLSQLSSTSVANKDQLAQLEAKINSLMQSVKEIAATNSKMMPISIPSSDGSGSMTTTVTMLPPALEEKLNHIIAYVDKKSKKRGLLSR